MRYADIVLPLAQPLYTFAVAEGVTLCEGMVFFFDLGSSVIYTRSRTGFIALSSMYSCANIFRVSVPP